MSPFPDRPRIEALPLQLASLRLDDHHLAIGCSGVFHRVRRDDRKECNRPLFAVAFPKLAVWRVVTAIAVGEPVQDPRAGVRMPRIALARLPMRLDDPEVLV